LSGHPELARVSKAGAAVAISLSMVALVHDLGRPARFINMLRVLKVTSPMSVGTWILSAYTPLVLGAAAFAVTGKLTDSVVQWPTGKQGHVWPGQRDSADVAGCQAPG
jgi:formate-dependent nitrite reductase membrane component NrfD